MGYASCVGGDKSYDFELSTWRGWVEVMRVGILCLRAARRKTVPGGNVNDRTIRSDQRTERSVCSYINLAL